VLDSVITGSITLQAFLMCTGASLILGLLTAGSHMIKNRYSGGFVLTLALLPAIVQIVIMMVNGNIGAGIAVAGAFSLVRFRSVPGSAREICSIFLAMALGLTIGMGYIGIAVLFFIIISPFSLLLTAVKFGEQKSNEKELRITIPENLDYEGIFDGVFDKYTQNSELYRVKTTNMGTLYELCYHVVLKEKGISKEFLDELRCRNGNLNVTCGRKSSGESL